MSPFAVFALIFGVVAALMGAGLAWVVLADQSVEDDPLGREQDRRALRFACAIILVGIVLTGWAVT